MVGMQVRTRSDVPKVRRKVRRANITNLGHAGGTIRKVARHSIRRSPNPSAPGKPPHTRKGQLRSSILYAVEKNKQSVVIGPGVALAGRSATAHDFGGRYKRQRYPRRRFIGPALEQTRAKLPRHWAGSVR